MTIQSRFLKTLTTRNVGRVDRLIRALFLPLTGWLVYQQVLSGPVAWLSLMVGFMLMLTAVMGSCSVYYFLGFSTCPISGKERKA